MHTLTIFVEHSIKDLHTTIAKPMKALELDCPMIQVLIKLICIMPFARIACLYFWELIIL